MLRNANDPTAEIRSTTEDRELVSACPTCRNEVRVTIPAGTLLTVARFVAGLTPECDPCADRREAEHEREEQVRLRRQRVDASNLPPKLRKLTWESYLTDDPRWPKARPALVAARAWASETAPRKGLLVSGTVGTGKTRLAATAAWEMLLRRDVRYVSVPDLIIRLGASFGDKDRADALRVLTGRGALILDDLDKIKPSTHVLTHLYTAIDNRYQAGAPLFVTTNLDAGQLVAYFRGSDEDAERAVTAEAIVSRLMEHCVIGRVDGPDRRRG
jgi:DNA replication protein DnaC